jgi:tetratricopeptide (TPR) repeat protein
VGLLGWDQVMTRLRSVPGDLTASRWGLWRDVLPVVPRVWLTGTGGGTFSTVESLCRTWGNPEGTIAHAHNEYLEAILEGGIFRLAVMLTLVGLILRQLLRTYQRCPDTPNGLAVLGQLFGLLVVMIHAMWDFSLHMPAVALLAAVVCGVASASPSSSLAFASRDGPASPTSHLLTGWQTLVHLGLLVVAGLSTWDACQRARAYRYELAANWSYAHSPPPTQLKDRLRFSLLAWEQQPQDWQRCFLAAQAHLDVAVAKLAEDGPVAEPATKPFAGQLTPDLMQQHIVPALRLLLAARAANALAPEPHTRLALLAEAFARSEPATTHLQRAKRLLTHDPELWYISGWMAFQRGQRSQAWGDWKTSLLIASRISPQMSPRRLSEIVRVATVSLREEELLQVLPNEPVVLRHVVEQLPLNDANRRFLLQTIVQHTWKDGSTAEFLAAIARSCGDLRDFARSGQAWQRALETAPDAIPIRDGWAGWLESREAYAEAVPHLEWLVLRVPGQAEYAHRLEAARHGRRLAEVLGLHKSPSR